MAETVHAKSRRRRSAALSWRARRRWALFVLLIGLPVYIVTAVGIIARLDRPGILGELLVYAGLGVVWALPFRLLFAGIGRADPSAASESGEPPSADDRVS